MRNAVVRFLLLCAALTLPGVGYAQVVDNYICDPGLENCRTKLIALIDAETPSGGIDAAFWFMEDTRFSQALIRAKNRGVQVRAITDSRGWAGGSDYPGYPLSKLPVDQMYEAGIPLRQKTGSGGILHFKMMIFYGQNMVQFSGGNYTPAAFVRQGYPTSAPYSDYVDEAFIFTDDPGLVKSFMTRFDDLWTNVVTSPVTATGTQNFVNYCPAPIPASQGDCVNRPQTRRNDPFPIDPEMNFVPWENFRSRAVKRYNAETKANGGGIDAIIYRITDSGHTTALINAAKRGVPVRVITEPQEYRNENRYWNSYNMDLLYLEGQKCAANPTLCAGTGSITVRFRKHLGLLHEKLSVLRGQQMVIVGSSNWTSSSASGQTEHNLFGTRLNRPWLYDWSAAHFDHKWTDPLTRPFVPLDPEVTPQLRVPANAAQNQPLSVTLKWFAGFWGMKYDVWLGTSSTNMELIASEKELGPSASANDLKSFVVPTTLAEGTTYFWQVRSSTMAGLSRTSSIFSFRTSGGTPPTTGEGDVLMHAYRAPVRAGWAVVNDATAAGGKALTFPNAGAATRGVSATPADYFEVGFTATAGVPYRIWLRGKAQSNSWANDSAFVQFDDSVNASGVPQWRIGTTSATTVTIEDCSSCGLAGWGWNDNLTNGTAGALGPLVYFETTGTHRIRIQVREDGLTIDQIKLMRAPTAGTPAPGTPKNDATIYPEQGVANLSGEPPPPPPPPACGPLQTGWASVDIGAVSATGQSCFDTSTSEFTMRGAGADIWGSVDEFQFAYKQLTGDGTLTVNVTQLQAVDRWTKTGAMMRNTLSANSAHATMFVSPSMGLAFQRRGAAGGATTHTGATGAPPHWLRMVRAGDLFTAYSSTDGSSWTEVGSATIVMNATIYVGIPLTSHVDGSLASATIRDVSIAP